MWEFVLWMLELLCFVTLGVIIVIVWCIVVVFVFIAVYKITDFVGRRIFNFLPGSFK